MNETIEGEKALNQNVIKENIDPENYFGVRAWLWNEEDEDHSLEIKHHDALKVFREFQDAHADYEALDHDDFPEAGEKDMRLELIHFRFGTPNLVRSRILFPKRAI